VVETLAPDGGNHACPYSFYAAVQENASAQWAASIHDCIALETITGEGGWMDQVLLLDGPYIKDGYIQVTDKPGLGYELNPDVVRAHLAAGETWWTWVICAASLRLRLSSRCSSPG